MAIELKNPHNLPDDDEVNIDRISSSGILDSMGSDDDDDDDGSSDTSSVLTELSADDFPGHFREHGGRLFHSHGNLPYPLPVDGEEQTVCRHLFSYQPHLTSFLQRLNAQHKVLRDLLGSHFVDPVAEALAYESDRQKRVLDLCTGTGRWYVISSDWTLIHLIRVCWIRVIG